MSADLLSEQFLVKIAGWQAIKEARALLQQGKVLSANWTPPILKGVVQEGANSYRAGLVIKDAIDLENLCSCRASRQWGTICAHSVAVGLKELGRNQPEPNPATAPVKVPDAKPLGSWLARIMNEQAEPARIVTIFPPNFEQALQRPSFQIYFELEQEGRRLPFGHVKEGNFPDVDIPLLTLLSRYSPDAPPAVLTLTNDQAGQLLALLSLNHKIRIGKDNLTVSAEPIRPRIHLTLTPAREINVALHNPPPSLLRTPKSAWVFWKTERKLEKYTLPVDWFSLFDQSKTISAPELPAFLLQDLPLLRRDTEVIADFDLNSFKFETAAPGFKLELNGGLAFLNARLTAVYGSSSFFVAEGLMESGWLKDSKNEGTYRMRDAAAEKRALNRLLRYGFSNPNREGFYKLSGENNVLKFFALEYPAIQRDWKVTLEERLEHNTLPKFERIEPKFSQASSGIDWLDLSVSFDTPSERLSPADVQRLLLSGQSHRKLPNGKIVLFNSEALNEFQEVLRDISPQQNSAGYRVKKSQLPFLQTTIIDLGWDRANAGKVLAAKTQHTKNLGTFEEILRDYQKEGVNWMLQLREDGFNGILADEMGLGKTIQTLALLSLTRSTTNKPHLVVAPTTLLFNWLSEAKKFTPHLKVLLLSGAQRQARFSEINGADVVLTSYALIRRDADNYRSIEFDTVVLDEAQHIKNRQTQNAQAVKSILADHRLVLTGTPLENSVLDLWSIFDFLMPGYLGAANDFRERYEQPITRDKDARAQLRLHRRVKPFMLRRLKSEVARDLPAKIEQVRYCELTDQQRAVYQQLVAATRKEVLDAIGEQGLARSRMMVLTALLRLRQVCCDLRLLDLPDHQKSSDSGKVEAFSELLDEVIDGGHRVLVFSQFVKMLALLKEQLGKEGVPYCYLDGSTQDRGAVVEQFQSTPGIPVFLISLKAGGVGLNLTAADTVIHFDPWWNPAIEDQATDRAHRIGQTNVVTSYKLITQGTVEEKILQLQTKKRALLKGMLAGEEALLEALTEQEVQELFSE